VFIKYTHFVKTVAFVAHISGQDILAWHVLTYLKSLSMLLPMLILQGFHYMMLC